MKMNLTIVTLKIVPSPPALAAGLSLASAGAVRAKMTSPTRRRMTRRIIEPLRA
jgi:hypothetical protein